MRVWLCLLAVLVVVLVPAPASACKCGLPEPAVVIHPYLDTVEGIAAGPSDVFIDCDRDGCTWRSSHVLRNATTADIHTMARVVTMRASIEAVRIDGAAASITAAADEDVWAILVAVPEDDRRGGQANGAQFSVRVPAGGEVEIVVVAKLDPERWDCGCSFWGVEARHPVVSKRSKPRHIVYRRVQTLRPREDAGLIAWISARGEGVSARQGKTHRLRRAQGSRRFQVALDHHEAGALDVKIDRDDAFDRFGPNVLAGGPIFGVGGGFGDGRGLRLRGGYEFAAPQFLAIAAVVESDARTHVEVIPSIELVPPWGRVLSLIPMPALGVGAPVQVWPTTRAGFRTQLSVGWYIFTIIGSFDVYPATGSGERLLRGGLLGQFSF